MYKMQLLVCGGTGCRASASAKIVEKLNESLKAHGLMKMLGEFGCFGFCEKGLLLSDPDNTFYTS